ncbi:MAG: MiaB/RimO family radical SAM methylthiotransferase, partial [candidate division WOR-3 bacterium]
MSQQAISVINIGCRLNQAEGDALAGLPLVAFAQLFKSTPRAVYIVNTCAVTETAVNSSLKAIKRIIKHKSSIQGAGGRLIVTGCLTALAQIKLSELNGVDLVLSHHKKLSLLKGGHFSVSTRARPIIKIQDGCINECTFCIARLIRGKTKSVPIENVLNKIKNITDLGYQEIVLSGLNLGLYGVDLGGRRIIKKRKLPDDTFRIRLSSIQPEAISDELLTLWQDKKICRHLHIPLQSGDDKILRLMRRKYSANDYRRKIEMVIKKIPGVNIGCDIIVGFPYEDEPAFLNTVKLIEDLPFGYLHIFPYSKRPFTTATTLPDTVSPEVKKARLKVLKEIDKKKRQTFYNKFVNTQMEVLVENNAYGLT